MLHLSPLSFGVMLRAGVLMGTLCFTLRLLSRQPKRPPTLRGDSQTLGDG